jgi:ankyrin repeat protein
VEERAEESAYLNAIVSQASPVRSMPLPRYASHPLTSSHQYISWLQNTRSDVLVVHGQKPMQRVSGFAFEEILRTYSTDDIKTYFSFDRNDDRYNSTRAFLMTTAAQWVTIEQVAEADFGFRHEMSRFHSQRSFTDEDLLVLLFRVRTIYTNGETVFVLNNLDECVDKLASFWRLVAEAFESREKPWKLLIFTKSVDSLDDWLKSWPRIALEDGFSLEDINPCVRDEIDCTLHKFDFDHAVGPTIRNYRDDLIRKCDNDIGLTRLLLHDIQNCQSQETLITTLETLPDISIETIFDRSMDAIPGAKRSLAARAITWILFAFRPLSIGELRSALSIAEHTQVLDGTDIINALDDIPIFDFSNTQEVRFQHVKLRDFVLQAQNVWYDVKATAHEMIVERCLDIIGTPAAYESLSAVCTVQHGLLSTPSVKPRTDLAPYAVCYWVRHYCLAPNKSSLIPQVLKFFKDETASRRWQMAHWFMSDPLSRTDRTYLSKLPLLAATGLQDIYERWIVENGISPVDEQTWLPYAVAEAARNGHRNSTLNLLPSVELNSTTAEYVLEAAGSSGEEDVLTGLISHIRTTLPSYIWPAFLVRRASWIGYARVVHALIEAGADLSGSDGAAFGQCSSHVAARNGQVEVVKLLVKHDERLVHALDEKKRTVLSYATMHGSVQMVKVLLENGAPANESKLIPISNACSHGAHAAVRVLLEHGAQTETTQDEPDWWPPLHEAILEGAYRCVQVLLEFNADPNYEGPDGTALQAAVTHNQIEIVKLLVEHDADVNRRRDEDTKTAVHNAISLKSDMTIARYLVEKGADVNLRTSLSSPLFSACLNNNADMVRLLLEKGANVNDVFDGIWTPLHGAYNSAVVTRLLLEAGALVDRVLEKSGRSPLFLAAEWGQTDVVEVLLEYNADVNLQYLLQEEEDSMSGFTPLVATLSEKHGGAARLLLEAGADTSVKPTNGLLPLTYAKTTELLRMVLEFRPDLTLRDTDGDTVLNAIMHRPTIELADVKLLVHAGIDVNAANKDGRTTLHKAIDWDELDIARFLLRRGADIELSALNAGTPLHLACWSGSLAGVRLLKDAGADINIVNAYFGSPAQAVCGRSSPLVSNFNVVERTMLDMLRCLSESSSSPAAAGGTAMKLDVNAAGGLFGSALGAACYHATVPVIEFLLNIGALTDTCDQAGRRPIHFAAVGQSTANFETLRDANADLYARDKAGRTIVHFAIVSGRLDLLQCVLQSTDGLLDVADDDGWTPLHYAARGTYHRFANLDGIEEQNERKHEFVAFLIDEHDADVWALSSGPDGKQWSPLKLANYHGAKQKTLDLLTPTTKMSADGTAWNEDFHKSKKAFGQDVGCDACCFVSLSFPLPQLT